MDQSRKLEDTDGTPITPGGSRDVCVKFNLFQSFFHNFQYFKRIRFGQIFHVIGSLALATILMEYSRWAGTNGLLYSSLYLHRNVCNHIAADLLGLVLHLHRERSMRS